MQKGFAVGWALILVMILILLAGGYFFWSQKNNQTLKNPAVSTPIPATDQISNTKSCASDSDCTLFICSGCFNKEWAKNAPPDPACITYQGYSCQCLNNTCTTVH